jgi:Kdo2-lipid IVA lauroyltransferase/acyltransferase
MAGARAKPSSRRGLTRLRNAVVGAFAVGALKFLRLIDADRLAGIAGWVMRRIGPLLPENEVGRANLAAAFPEKSTKEIDAILRGVWDNLGRVSALFAHLDRIWDYDFDHPERSKRYEIGPATRERLARLAGDGKPALIFAAHLANWELPAICAASYGIDTTALYRRPNIPAIDRWLHNTRSASMGTLIAAGPSAPTKIVRALERGSHVGILVDQYYLRGVEINFFGRRTMANPLLARLARHFDCPIHGVRFIRLPDNRFRGELTEEIKPMRDAHGAIDVAGTTQIINTIIEGWIREHPEQWLWLHRRWRPEDQAKISARS